MRAAGVNQASGQVVPLDLADPRPLRDGEILLRVQAAGTVAAPTADQALSGALRIRPGETVLVHGGGGVTGGLLVQLAAHYGWPGCSATGCSG